VKGSLVWHGPAEIMLVEGWTLTDAEGRRQQALSGVKVATDGGFLHIDVPGVVQLQIVGAPALRLLTYERQ
jgi:hypothetical protein